MTEDELIRESIAGLTAYRYHCRRCGYLTGLLTQRHAALVQRIHRHRHLVGLAGYYHPDRT